MRRYGARMTSVWHRMAWGPRGSATRSIIIASSSGTNSNDLITATDFVCVPYSPDLTQAGISYACRSLPHTYDRMGGSPFDRLRRIVTGIAVELAFRRYLSGRDVPFDVKGATPFTAPDR